MTENLYGNAKCYLHSILSTETINLNLDRASRKQRHAEAELDGLVRLTKRIGVYKVPMDKIDHMRILRRGISNYSRHIDTLNEELQWREDPEELAKFYVKQGFKLVYICNNQDFGEYKDALSEAHFVHSLNELKLAEGADDEGEDDLVEPERMIRARFILAGRDQR